MIFSFSVDVVDNIEKMHLEDENQELKGGNVDLSLVENEESEQMQSDGENQESKGDNVDSSLVENEKMEQMQLDGENQESKGDNVESSLVDAKEVIVNSGDSGATPDSAIVGTSFLSATFFVTKTIQLSF